MKKLDSETIASRDGIISRLRTLHGELEEAIDAYNTKMSAAWEKTLSAAISAYNAQLDDAWGGALEPVIEAYNGAVADANQWKAGAAQSIQDYMDERSDKWQETVKGQQYAEWRDGFDDEFQTFDAERPEDIEIDEPDGIGFDAEDIAELLEQLQTELESGD